MFLLFFYLFIALFISFLCSILESVLLSTPISFLNVKIDEGSKKASVFLKLKDNVERPLAAILSLNTIAHTIGAAGVGAEATKLFGEVYFGVVSAVLTLLILIFSEIIPKTIGAIYWRKLAILSGIVIHFMVIITYPLVLFTTYLSKIIASKQEEASISREEISAMAKIGTEEGVFEEKENRIIQNLIRLKSINVTDIMTPRVVVTVADENMSLKEFLKNKEYLYYSRIPIYSGNKDNITGYVFRQKIFEGLAEGKNEVLLKEISHEIVVISEFQTLFNTWDKLLNKKEHIALVVDEYGGMDGIVTMEDIIETLLGLEIVDEHDKVVDMQQYARERWKERQAKYNVFDD